MDTKRAVAVVLVLALVVGATPALGAFLTNSVPIEDQVPTSTPQTPTIILDSPGGTTDVNLTGDTWQGSTLRIETADGNMTVTGDTGATATVDTTDIEGTQTQLTSISAGSSWLEVDPDDKNRLDVRGDADSVAFEAITVDDGNTDIQLTGTQGGTAELRLYGLAANTDHALYDSSRDEVLGNFTTDASGVGQTTVDMPDGSHALEVRTKSSFAQPNVTNPAPTGRVTFKPDNITVDAEAEAWNATVEYEVEGTTADTVEIEQNGTVKGDIASEVDVLGEYQYTVTVTDAFGRTDSVTGTFETPSNISLREEHNATQKITGADVTIRFFTADGDVAVQRTSDQNGVVNMTGLPDSQFVAFAESDDHYDRTIFIESIFTQETMYLLNETARNRTKNEAVRSRFIFEDFTGKYPQQDSTVQIQRALDPDGDNKSQFRTVAGDFWGASSEYETILERGARYRLVLVNQETGESTVAGTHIPTESLTQTVRISGLIAQAENESGITALAQLNESSGDIEIAYTDPAGKSDLNVTVENGSGHRIYSDDVNGVESYVATVSLTSSQQDEDWFVTFDATDSDDGSPRHRSVVPVGSGTIGLPVAVPPWLLTLLMSMSVTFVGALYGPRTALMGAWAMVFVAAGVAMFGWAFSSASVIVAALVATGFTLLTRALP